MNKPDFSLCRVMLSRFQKKGDRRSESQSLALDGEERKSLKKPSPLGVWQGPGTRVLFAGRKGTERTEAWRQPAWTTARRGDGENLLSCPRGGWTLCDTCPLTSQPHTLQTPGWMPLPQPLYSGGRVTVVKHTAHYKFTSIPIHVWKLNLSTTFKQFIYSIR